MTARNNDFYMGEALELSKKALPACLPNPPVGCIITSNNKVVASGYTQSHGADHAEASALKQLDQKQESFNDLIMYVTLEPCSFTGLTPACAKRILNYPIREVHIGMIDPDKRNNGKSVQFLSANDIKVTVGTHAEKIKAFLKDYLNYN